MNGRNILTPRFCSHPLSTDPQFPPARPPNVCYLPSHMKQKWIIPARIGLVFCGLIAATIGFALGDHYHIANYTQLATMLQKWASESDRMKLVNIGTTEEGRTEYQAIISSPANLAKLDHYKDISQKLARGRITAEEAK